MSQRCTALTGSKSSPPVGDGPARLWDAASGEELRQLTGHTDDVIMAAYSPDGKQIVTTSLDKTARIWDSASGEELRELTGHTDGVVAGGVQP